MEGGVTAQPVKRFQYGFSHVNKHTFIVTINRGQENDSNQLYNRLTD